MELLRQFAGARRVGGQEHLDHRLAVSMRPAALMRGAIWNATCRDVGNAPSGESGDVQQRAQSGIAHLAQAAQARA